MAEKRQGKAAKGEPKPEGKKPREIRDAGQRVVFAGLTMDSQRVAKMLAESMELPPLPGVPAPDEKAKKAELEKLLGLLHVEDGGGVTVWVQVGPTVDGSPTKPEAVEAAVDKPLGREAVGRFRAPTLTHWRGEDVRKPPTAVPLARSFTD